MINLDQESNSLDKTKAEELTTAFDIFKTPNIGISQEVWDFQNKH